jgi:MFS family permease
MDEFEKLKQSWKQQEAPETINSMNTKAMDEFTKLQRKIVFSNLVTSVGFALAFIVLGWVWASFPDRTPFFYIGIALAYLLMIVMLFVLWSSVKYRDINSSLASRDYLQQVRNKLLLRRRILTTYTPVYSVLLFLALGCYYLDFTKGQSFGFIASLYGGTAVYLGFIWLITRKKKRKNLERIDTLLRGIDELDSKLST